MGSAYSIRLAIENDVKAICSFDEVAKQNERRRLFVSRSVEAGNCFVVTDDAQIAAYGVFVYTFFSNGFISMLYVHPDHRRFGVGMMLMKHFESICQTPKLFTSTNLSNLPMQSLLAKLNYKLSGVIHDLDENDPEL